MTDAHELIARSIAKCTCHAPNAAPADNRGPLKDGSHYANCHSELADDIADALRAAERAGLLRAAQIARDMANAEATDMTRRIAFRDVHAAIEGVVYGVLAGGQNG